MKKIILGILLLTCVAVAGNIELTGTVVSDNKKMLTSRYMGFIKNVHVSEGDRVIKGQLLYEIDSKEIDSSKIQVELGIQQARLSLQMYRNQHTNLLLNLARNKRLFAKDMVSKYQLESLELAEKNLVDMMKVARKQVQQAEASLTQVMNQYNYLKVKAPNDGVIVQKNINAGEMAIPGMPALVLTDLSKLKILTEVAESNLQHMRIGKEVKVNIPSSGLQTIGHISSIIPSSNPMTHTFKIKIDFEKNDKMVYPGLYTKIVFED